MLNRLSQWLFSVFTRRSKQDRVGRQPRCMAEGWSSRACCFRTAKLNHRTACAQIKLSYIVCLVCSVSLVSSVFSGPGVIAQQTTPEGLFPSESVVTSPSHVGCKEKVRLVGRTRVGSGEDPDAFRLPSGRTVGPGWVGLPAFPSPYRPAPAQGHASGLVYTSAS